MKFLSTQIIALVGVLGTTVSAAVSGNDLKYVLFANGDGVAYYSEVIGKWVHQHPTANYAYIPVSANGTVVVAHDKGQDVDLIINLDANTATFIPATGSITVKNLVTNASADAVPINGWTLRSFTTRDGKLTYMHNTPGRLWLDESDSGLPFSARVHEDRRDESSITLFDEYRDMYLRINVEGMSIDTKRNENNYEPWTYIESGTLSHEPTFT